MIFYVIAGRDKLGAGIRCIEENTLDNSAVAALFCQERMRYGHPRGSIILTVEAIPFERFAGDGVELDMIAIGQAEVHGDDAVAAL